MQIDRRTVLFSKSVSIPLILDGKSLIIAQPRGWRIVVQLQAHTFYNRPLSTSVHCCFTAAHHSTTFETNMSDVIKAVEGLGTM